MTSDDREAAMKQTDLNRRDFLLAASLAAAAGWPSRSHAASEKAGSRWPVCVFVKFIQSLSFEELSLAVAEMGFQGIEATVRPKGIVLPEQAADQLPKLVEALKRNQLDLTILSSGINRVDSPHAEAVLKTAASLGIKQYRMDYYKYDLKRPIAPQIEELKPVVLELAAMNKELGIQGVYQTHAGANFVGATIWDLHLLLEGIPKEQIGIAYDTRHAAVESGLSWPVLWNLVQPNLAAVFVKNARWKGTHLEDVPLSEPGVTGQKFFKFMHESTFQGPISLHVEYLEKGTTQENLAAIKSDFAALRNFLKAN